MTAPVRRRGKAPARGYSWPPFGAGNDAAVKHGARGERFVQPIADDLHAWLVEVAPWCAQPAFRAAVAAWSYAEAQCVLLRRWIDGHNVVDEDGKPLPALDALERAEGRAGRLRVELGLTPSSWARLLARLSSADHESAARGLAALKAVGAELTRTAALPAAAMPVESGDDGDG